MSEDGKEELWIAKTIELWWEEIGPLRISQGSPDVWSLILESDKSWTDKEGNQREGFGNCRIELTTCAARGLAGALMRAADEADRVADAYHKT